MIGVVIIGRNEGQRLFACLNSLQNVERIVYVDSGSTDNSVQAAQQHNAFVVELDTTIPFTAARARNHGARKLLELFPELQFVQFIDGDCELQPGWLHQAKKFLKQNETFAIVCGRRRERYPAASVYNQLCDIEWNTSVGKTDSCGGDAMIRVTAFNSVGGYRDSMIAGEEPEMCFRLRQLGWEIMRLDVEMTMHDVAMSKFSQWWKRNIRTGYAYAESYFLHGHSNEVFRGKELKSIITWAVIIPLLILTLSIVNLIFLIVILIYPIQLIRLTFRYKKELKETRYAIIYSVSNLFSKWPQCFGALLFIKNKFYGRLGNIIEYK